VNIVISQCWIATACGLAMTMSLRGAKRRGNPVEKTQRTKPPLSHLSNYWIATAFGLAMTGALSLRA